jgi:hypothetical protein
MSNFFWYLLELISKRFPWLLIIISAIIFFFSTIRKMKQERNLKHKLELDSSITKAHIDKLVLEIRIEFIICSTLGFTGIILVLLK